MNGTPDVAFLNPGRLWLLLGVALVAVGYVLMQRRRSRYAVRFTNLRLLDKVAPSRPAWRRHVPAALFIAMLALLVVGFARPTDEVRVPKERATVMIAVDVSASMLATDVPPDRLRAAKEAARDFADQLPRHFNVGLVAFAGNATVVVPPSPDRDVFKAGVDRLSETTAGLGGTAIGEAITTSLDAIRSIDAQADKDPPPARIVLLSDGANTSGRDPDEAAAESDTAGIPVDTISFGTTAGEIARRGGVAMSVPVDGETLRGVAEKTNGSYHEADSKEELRAVYADIGTSVGYVNERADVSARFIGLALILAMVTALASMFWFSRIP
ncbi:membrane protein [Asanoa ishikariensis]|uniref:Ca-activated chloride channel family protein n=1 Tax=Asanoa ishikariensis TaxID=137265 RepID=A0A1H3RHJ2_9ACTN|nr:VWA domain-containing protein [Asanoa ishikariensis]GIF67201.1 membrane protein [Asanoa ishikariensis]SDZ25194.1 Ca-activated chloride channel family protein [Asanoa ishikariensis]